MRVVFFIFTIINTLAYGQNNIATTSAAFLEIGAGARSIGMGSAFTAVADDPSTLYWNPAGIVNVTEPEFQTFYSPWLVETQYFYNTAVLPVKRYGNLGLSFTSLGMDDMMVRTVEEPEPGQYGQKFSAGNIAMGLTFARKLTDRFSFGFKIKFIQETIWQMSAKGFAMDIGTLYTSSKDLKIGMSVSNYGGKLAMEGVNTLVDIDLDENIFGNNDRIDGNLSTSKWPLPLIFRFGLSQKIIFSEKINLLFAADAIHPNNNPEYVNLGLECNLFNTLFIRAGQSHTFYSLKLEDGDAKNSEQGLSFGAGIKYQIPRGPMLNIDYAITDFGVFKNIEGYSISISF